MCDFLCYRLAECKLSAKLCTAVASVLQFPNLLVDLDLSRNPLGDVGLESLAAGLHSSNNKLQTIRLELCFDIKLGMTLEVRCVSLLTSTV